MMIEEKIAQIFSMDDNTWRRHANPWSVWSRFTVLPLFIIAIWSRVWIGWWCIIPIAISIAWTWYNPRFFSIPKSTNNWASKAVLGERVWLNRNTVSIPDRHKFMPNILSTLSASALPFLIWGVWQLDIWHTIVPCLFIYLGKLWFLDRMVWLFEDMKNESPEYTNWLYEDIK